MTPTRTAVLAAVVAALAIATAAPAAADPNVQQPTPSTPNCVYWPGEHAAVGT